MVSFPRSVGSAAVSACRPGPSSRPLRPPAAPLLVARSISALSPTPPPPSSPSSPPSLDSFSTSAPGPSSHASLPPPPVRQVPADVSDFLRGWPYVRKNQRRVHNIRFYANETDALPANLRIEDLLDALGRDPIRFKEDWNAADWLFPLPTPGFNSKARLLGSHEIQAISSDPIAMNRVERAYQYTLATYGIRLSDRKSGLLSRLRSFPEDSAFLQTSMLACHRLTRLLKFLSLISPSSTSFSGAPSPGSISLSHHSSSLVLFLLAQHNDGHVDLSPATLPGKELEKRWAFLTEPGNARLRSLILGLVARRRGTPQFLELQAAAEAAAAAAAEVDALSVSPPEDQAQAQTEDEAAAASPEAERQGEEGAAEAQAEATSAPPTPALQAHGWGVKEYEQWVVARHGRPTWTVSSCRRRGARERREENDWRKTARFRTAMLSRGYRELLERRLRTVQGLDAGAPVLDDGEIGEFGEEDRTAAEREGELERRRAELLDAIGRAADEAEEDEEERVAEWPPKGGEDQEEEVSSRGEDPQEALRRVEDELKELREVGVQR